MLKQSVTMQAHLDSFDGPFFLPVVLAVHIGLTLEGKEEFGTATVAARLHGDGMHELWVGGDVPLRGDAFDVARAFFLRVGWQLAAMEAERALEAASATGNDRATKLIGPARAWANDTSVVGRVVFDAKNHPIFEGYRVKAARYRGTARVVRTHDGMVFLVGDGKRTFRRRGADCEVL